jgi:hypothetical protein
MSVATVAACLDIGSHGYHYLFIAYSIPAYIQRPRRLIVP